MLKIQPSSGVSRLPRALRGSSASLSQEAEFKAPEPAKRQARIGRRIGESGFGVPRSGAAFHAFEGRATVAEASG
jgi:hypothetical protein